LPGPAEADDAFAIVIPGRPGQSFPVPGAGFAPVPHILSSLEQTACKAGDTRAACLMMNTMVAIRLRTPSRNTTEKMSI
jgi:hypothetical protein